MANGITTSVTFILRSSDQKSLQTICIRIRHYNHRKSWALRDLRVTKINFTKINQIGKRVTPELNDIRSKMEKYKAEALSIINVLGADFSFEKFAELFFGKKQVLSRQAKFSVLVDEYISCNSLSIQTQRGYRTMLNRVSEIFPSLIIGDLSEKVLLEFRNKLKDKLTPSSITIYMRYIKAVWNFAVRKGWISDNNSPFRGIKLPTSVQKKRALHNDHIRLLKAYYTEDASVQKAVDFFLISFYCNGINFKDMLELRSSNFIDNYIFFKRAKTRNSSSKNIPTITVGISMELKKLLDKWALIDTVKDTYVFPFLNDSMDETRRQRVIEQFIQITNKRLASVQEELRIPIKLTTYVARHSFASSIVREIKNPFIINRFLGHSTVQQSSTYVENINTNDADEAAAILSAI